jgi:hypothetical protein
MRFDSRHPLSQVRGPSSDRQEHGRGAAGRSLETALRGHGAWHVSGGRPTVVAVTTSNLAAEVIMEAAAPAASAGRHADSDEGGTAPASGNQKLKPVVACD